MIGESWDDLNVEAQADIIAWHHLRENEILKEKIEFAKSMVPQL